jgi:hypothetical protein
MLAIGGSYQQGTGTASSNLKIQLPIIAQAFPEVINCHGTINVKLDTNLFVITPDHRTGRIRWNDGNFPDGEVFDLLRVSLAIPDGSAAFDAWLYIAHGSPHRAMPDVHEFISHHWANNITHGMQCRLLIYREYFSVPPVHPPYTHNGIYIV